MLQVSNDYLQKPSLITVQGIGFSLAQLDKDEAFGKRLTKVRGLLQLEKDKDSGESRRTARRKQSSSSQARGIRTSFRTCGRPGTASCAWPVAFSGDWWWQAGFPG